MADILASVSVVLGAEISGFRAAMAQARRELSGLVKFSEGLKDVGESLTKYVSLPIAAMGVGALKIGGDFESAFNRVQAATQASGSELEALRKKAQGIALDPDLQFTSVQAAQALENLAKNGASTADILGGAVDATTALATATGGQLATAADITTDVMNNFGRSAQEAAGLVSSITGATIASKFSIDDYRQALGQAGAVAGQLGVAFEEFNTALSITSSGFSSGSDAGTSFKTFLQRLVPQSKEAAAAMEKLGLDFFDAQGKMRPLREVAGQLQQAFSGLSDQAKNTFGTQIFGADSIRTALLLAKDGAEGFDRMADSISKVNAASQGAILNQGFTGGLEAFKSAAEGLGQAIADSGILAFADGLLRRAASLAAGLAQLNPAVLGTATVVAGLAAAVGPAALALGTLGAALPAIRAGIVEVRTATLLLQNNMVLLRGALAAVLSPTGAIVAALVTLGAVIYAANTEGERAYATFQKQVEATRKLDSSLTPLLDRYDQLKSKTNLSAAEQEELRSVVQRVTDIMPEAGTRIDEYGNFIDIAAQKARKSIATFEGIDKSFALASLPAAKARLKELESSFASLQKAAEQVNETGKLNGVALSSLGDQGAAENLGYLREDIAKVGEELDKQRKQVKDFEQAAGVLAGTIGGKLTQALTEADIALKFFGSGGQGIAAQVGLLASLREQLDAVRKARENEATEKAIFADDKVIAALEAEIARLEGLAKAGSKLRDVYAEVQKSLADVGRLSTALGDQYEYLKNRQSATESGIKKLVEAGYSPASKAVQRLVADLRNLNTTLGDNNLLAQRTVKGTEKLFETPDLELPKADFSLPEIKLKPIDTAPFTASLNEATSRLARFQKVAEDFNDGLSQILTQGMNNIAVGFGEAIGNILTGASGLEGLGAAILAPVGDMIVQLGQLAIAAGIGIQAIKSALDTLNPVLAIGAGIALVAIGTAVKGAASNIAKSGSGGAVSSAVSSPRVDNYGQNSNSTQKIVVEVVSRLRAGDLVAVGRGNAYRNRVGD